MAQLDISTEETGDRVGLVLGGELDIASAPQLEALLAQAEASGPSTIIVDLRGLDFMDSTGLRVIVSADARARETARRLVVVRGAQTVQKVFQITGLDGRLDMVDAPEDL